MESYLRLELNLYRRKTWTESRHDERLALPFAIPYSQNPDIGPRTLATLSATEARIQWCRGELEAAEHSGSTIRTYVRISRDFLGYLHRAGVDLNDAQPLHVSAS